MVYCEVCNRQQGRRTRCKRCNRMVCSLCWAGAHEKGKKGSLRECRICLRSISKRR